MSHRTEGIHDIADGLRRQRYAARSAQVSARDPQRVEDHAPVMRAGAVQIGAGDRADGALGWLLGR
jgi:hypothetical protein